MKNLFMMKNCFIAASVTCLIGVCICHWKTGDAPLQLAMRYIIDGILAVLWLKVAIRYRVLAVKEKALKNTIGPIQEKEDRLCREIDALLASSFSTICKNPEVFGR